jgi:hypothetical protein
MTNGHGPWTGHDPHNLQQAFVNAWETAKEAGANPGTFKCEITIDTSNPIHSYNVTITPQ